MPAEAYRLFLRLLVCFLLGNTDAHLKNFAMFHKREGLHLTPCYDLVGSSIYPEYQSIALQICGIRNMQIGKLEPKHIVKMSAAFNIPNDMLENIVATLKNRLPDALTTVANAKPGSNLLKKKIIGRIEKRWNGSFASIGKLLLKKQRAKADTGKIG